MERVGILLLVGSAIFQFATGIANAQLYYPWHFNFVEAHYYGGLIFIAALVLHVAVKLPAMRRAYATRARGRSRPSRRACAAPRPGAPDAQPPRAVRARRRAPRGLLAVTTAGQSIGGPLRELALLAPRGDGRDGFPINKTAAVARITPAMAGPAWRLELVRRATSAS